MVRRKPDPAELGAEENDGQEQLLDHFVSDPLHDQARHQTPISAPSSAHASAAISNTAKSPEYSPGPFQNSTISGSVTAAGAAKANPPVSRPSGTVASPIPMPIAVHGGSIRQQTTTTTATSANQAMPAASLPPGELILPIQ